MKWENDGLRFRLRVDASRLPCGLEEAMGLSNLRDGEHVVIYPAHRGGRAPAGGRAHRQHAHAAPARSTACAQKIEEVLRQPEGGVFVAVTMCAAYGGAANGFTFPAFPRRPFTPNGLYTLDGDPNQHFGYWCSKVTAGLRDMENGAAPGGNTLYDRIAHPGSGRVDWPDEAASGQARFLEGLDAANLAGLLFELEPAKRPYLGQLGAKPIVGPGTAGTGKSHTTAFAIFARMPGAMAAGRDFRVVASCRPTRPPTCCWPTCCAPREKLRHIRERAPELFAWFFDERLLEVPLYRIAPRGTVPEGMLPLPKDEDREKGMPHSLKVLAGQRWAVAGAHLAASTAW